MFYFFKKWEPLKKLWKMLISIKNLFPELMKHSLKDFQNLIHYQDIFSYLTVYFPHRTKAWKIP